MDTKPITMKLSNGRILDGLRMNGDNFISSAEVRADMFEGGLSLVEILRDGISETKENMELVQITRMNEEYWFVLREMTRGELDDIRIRADVDFIAMMTDVEL